MILPFLKKPVLGFRLQAPTTRYSIKEVNLFKFMVLRMLKVKTLHMNNEHIRLTYNFCINMVQSHKTWHPSSRNSFNNFWKENTYPIRQVLHKGNLFLDVNHIQRQQVNNTCNIDSTDAASKSSVTFGCTTSCFCSLIQGPPFSSKNKDEGGRVHSDISLSLIETSFGTEHWW